MIVSIFFRKYIIRENNFENIRLRDVTILEKQQLAEVFH